MLSFPREGLTLIPAYVYHVRHNKKRDGDRYDYTGGDPEDCRRPPAVGPAYQTLLIL
ncbi:hypothetical protein DPMN_101065 [Dreissena polymorpha]|uniref:Uncharacterized protein n=1 Tax=Dreissena polymorpha TaxID=45954 RepID=A0A9D4LGU3_DREPO|nr:hypothetical protein DPMN_101065 [Dreissena polymorpha]